MKFKNAVIATFTIVFFVFTLGNATTEQKKEMGGWEKDSKYNKLYDATETDDLRGWVVRIKEVVPMPGMSPGVAVDIRESKDADAEIITIHLCPTWFADAKNIGFKKGERIKIKGVWAEIGGKDIFIASKIKKGEFFELKVRLSSDGTPLWTLSAEELAKERAASQASLKKE